MTRVSPPLDEGVSEPTRRMERILGAKFEPKDLSAISTPREDEVERAASAMRPLLFEGGADSEVGPAVRHERNHARKQARAVLATLTPREQRMEEALNRAFDFLGGIGGSSKIRDTILSALSLQDKT